MIAPRESREPVPYLAEWVSYVRESSGHNRWPKTPGYWLMLGRVLAKYMVPQNAAQDAVDTVFIEEGSLPGSFPKHLARKLAKLRAPNLPAAGTEESPQCPICGKSGLLYVERRDGNMAEVPFPDGKKRFVRDFVASCNCPHGSRVRSKHDSPPWHGLESLNRAVYQPVGGWPVPHTPGYQPRIES